MTLSDLHAKHLNTPRLVADDTQKTVWKWEQQEPFGAGASNPDPDGDNVQFVFNLRFPGQYFDRETSLHFNYLRDYDPNVGRYIQSDPIGLAGGLNTYGYVYGRPLNSIDPTGALSLTDWLNVLKGNIVKKSDAALAKEQGEAAGKFYGKQLCSAGGPRNFRLQCIDACTNIPIPNSIFASDWQDACQKACIEEAGKCPQKQGGACPVMPSGA